MTEFPGWPRLILDQAPPQHFRKTFRFGDIISEYIKKWVHSKRSASNLSMKKCRIHLKQITTKSWQTTVGCRWTRDSPWKQLRQRTGFLQPAMLTALFQGTSHASKGHGKHPNMPSQRTLPCQQALYIVVTTRVFSCTVSENKHRPVLITSCLLSYQASGWFGCLHACILY